MSNWRPRLSTVCPIAPVKQKLQKLKLHNLPASKRIRRSGHGSSRIHFAAKVNSLRGRRRNGRNVVPEVSDLLPEEIDLIV